MGTNKKKVWKKSAVAAVVAVCALASSIPALAYRKPHEYVQGETDDWSDKDMLVFAQEGEENPMEGMHMDFSQGDTVFVGGKGNDYEVIDCNIRQGQQEQSQSICAHNYMTGTIAEHERHADGSCTVVTYRAQQCAKCGNAIRGDEVSSFTYKSCPHVKAGGVEPNHQAEDEMGVVNTDALKVRSAAAQDAAVIALLQEGVVAKVVAEENEFYRILIKVEGYENPLDGYVRKEYLDLPTNEMGIANSDVVVQLAEGTFLLKEGKNVRIIAEEGDFYKVLIKLEEFAEPLEGYVRKEYLNLIV